MSSRRCGIAGGRRAISGTCRTRSCCIVDSSISVRESPLCSDRTTVATIGPDVAGFVMVHNDELEQIYVAEAARGSGVAAALLRHAESEIGERFDLAWLAVVAGNTRARRFYARNGWRDAGVFEHQAPIEGGSVPLAAHRYEKRVHRKP